MLDMKSEDPVVASSHASADTYVPQAKPDFDMIVPTSYQPSKFRYIWIGCILVLVLSVVCVGAYVIDSEGKQPSSLIGSLLTPTPQTINLRAPTVTPTPNPAKMKLRYENKKYGFRFTYPGTWRYTEEESDELVYPLLDVSLVPNMSASTSGSISISVYNHGYTSVDEFARDYCREKSASCSATLTIAGRSGKRILNPPSSVAVEMAIFQNGKDIYQVEVEVANPQTKEINRKVFNDLLSSFVFDATSSAKTATPSGKVLQ